MTIGNQVNRALADNAIGRAAIAIDLAMADAAAVYGKLAEDLGHDGLAGIGYNGTPGTGLETADGDEAGSALRMVNYLGDLVKHYTGQTEPGFNFQDALKAVRGLGR